ncbi:MAG: tRNA (adenosine(37)-N6)-threonylcarbamoyltransferase complex transferase subunit TsaD [Patescibacteria group bacterium]
MKILAIETSCDETSASVLEEKKGKIRVLSNIVSSQIKIHAKFGGVVPNLASREHVKNIVPVLESALRESKINLRDIDLIAVTKGPGLIPALLIGVSAAKALAYATKKPLLGIHHIEGHIYANFVGESQKSKVKSQKREKIEFPVLCLVVSGGHTQLVLMKDHLKYKIIGETQDDAVGEAFDKVARILGLGYPGGPKVSQEAEKFKTRKLQPANYKLVLPRPMLNSKDFNFSFSGLKTAVLYETKKHPGRLKNKAYVSELCHEFQESVIDVLVSKTIRAGKKYKVKTIMLSGGVSANSELRLRMGEAVQEGLSGVSYQIPELAYCGDNAAMIATAALYRYGKLKDTKKLENNWKKLEAVSSLKLS